MKFLIVIALFFFGVTMNAQETPQRTTLTTVSYLGHFVTHPGIKLGKFYVLKSWDKFKAKKRKAVTKHKALFFSPQLGGYYHKQNHTGVLLNAELGKEVSKNDSAFFRGHTIGFGYNTQINAGTTYIEEKDGTISEEKWGHRGYYMPSLSCYFGHHLNPTVSWYNKLTIGSKLNYNTGVSLELFFEIGLRFRAK